MKIKAQHDMAVISFPQSLGEKMSNLDSKSQLETEGLCAPPSFAPWNNLRTCEVGFFE